MIRIAQIRLYNANMMNNINNMLTYGEILEDTLMKRHITKKQLAAAIGVSCATVSNWCTGSRMPTADKIVRISLYLGIDLYTAFGVPPHMQSITPQDIEFVEKVKKLSSDKKELLFKLVEHLS